MKNILSILAKILVVVALFTAYNNSKLNNNSDSEKVEGGFTKK